MQSRGRYLFEDPMRVEWPVIAADARVITSDDLIRATIVLSEQRMEHRLAWPRIAHVDGEFMAMARSRDPIRAELGVALAAQDFSVRP